MHLSNPLDRIAALRFLQMFRESGGNLTVSPAGDLVLQPTGGQLIVRQPGGVAGTDEVWVHHDGSHGYISAQSGSLILAAPDGNAFLAGNTTAITVYENLVPSGTRTLGTASAEWLSLYVGDAGGFYIGADQDYNIAYNEAGDDILKVYGGVAAANGDVELETTRTITGGVTDGYAASLHLDPGYTAATAQTVTRHNYIDLQGVSLAGAGPAALTDACVFRFDAAAGTHKATVGATTKTTPGGVDAWLKVNINGTLHYIPAYTSTTA